MASSSGTSLEQRRWVVVGIALQNVLTPCLRDKIQNEMTPFYQHVVANFGLHRQTYPTHHKTIPPSTVKLNYESINNNAALHRDVRHYDYCVKDEVSLAKLFMKPFMAHFNAFDSTFDASAALAVICGAIPFTFVRPFAEDVRSKVRNEWAHCNFVKWTDVQYNICFDLMETLVTNLRLLPADELSIIDELKLWRKRGLDMCLGKPLDDTLLHFIRNDVQKLMDSLHHNKEDQNKDIKSVCSTLALFKSEFERAITTLEEKQSNLQSVCKDLKSAQDMMTKQMNTRDEEQRNLLRSSEINWQMRQDQLEALCKTSEVKGSDVQRDLDVLKTKIESLSFSEDSKEIVFDVPEQNKWFTGREKEVSILEKCFPIKKCSGLKMAAICGLGGCGKTTLATHFAWKRLPEYEGGVFWISLEDDRKFENSLNDLALRLGMLADSFDLTLSKVLTYMSKRKKPWLLVLDDVDQLELSDQMRKVCCGRWKRQAIGHLLLTTRREPREVCESLDVEPSNCVEVFSFSGEESMSFLVTRSGLGDATGQEEVLKELVRELGGLPLALEQAGAHIKVLQCPISKYLEEYKSQRLKLLSQHPAKPASEYESQSRLAVHTTWLMNFEYVKKSAYGEAASRFVQAAAFLEPHEIQEELVDGKLLSSKADMSLKSSNGPLIKNHIIEVVTKFSLFQRISPTSLLLHRLVQEVIRTRMTTEETASSLLRAVRLLHNCFHRCPSPDQIIGNITGNVQVQASASVTNPSLFYVWSKLTSHSSELQQHLRSWLDQEDIVREVKTVVLTRETSRVIYENAVKLSVHGHQEEAKEAERFAFQILDSATSASKALSLDELRKLFPHAIPLSQMLQRVIFYSSRPPVENQKNSTFENQQSADIDAIRLQGNAFFTDGLYEEAISTYTEAIEGSKGTTHPDPRLLNNRATAYLKLGKFEECLQDSEEYIRVMPKCWKGYSRKALALNGLRRKLPALCSAAIAYYRDANCCRRYEAFKSAFSDLDGNWQICESSEVLRRNVMPNNNEKTQPKVLLLETGEYHVEKFADESHNSYTHFQTPIVNTALAALGNEAKVTLNSGKLCLEKDCFVQNITLSLESTLVAPNGNVEFENCLFRKSGSPDPLVHVKGAAIFHRCTIKDGGGCGVVVEGPCSSATMVQCHVTGNGVMGCYASGIRVYNKGRLVLHRCHIHGNTRGIWIDEESAGVLAKDAKITDSEIYDNKYEGILVAGLPPHLPVSLPVIIGGNKIFHNGTFGVRVMLNINEVILQNNVIFENFYWGVYIHSNSGGLYKGNEICNNKMGGIMTGKQSPGKPPCVIENNYIHDNCGPAFYEGCHLYEVYSFPSKLRYFLMLKDVENIFTGQNPIDFSAVAPDLVAAEFRPSNRCSRNDCGSTNLQSHKLRRYCAFCLRCDVELKSCKRCMTAKYCGKKCQEMHWGRHKYICKATSERHSVEIPLPRADPLNTFTLSLNRTYPGMEPSGPDYAPPPPRDGSRFIVKLQTYEAPVDDSLRNIELRGFVSEEQIPHKATLRVYDRSRHIDFNFKGRPQLYHLIMECGMMGFSMSVTKKLFCWAAFKDGKTIRIFTHEFPPVQRW